MKNTFTAVVIAVALSPTFVAQERGDTASRKPVALCRGDSAQGPATAPVTAKIAQMEWLSGTWIGTSGANTFEEHWTPAAGGSMLAVARSTRNGALSGFEFLCIVERNGGLVYQAMPNGRQPATDFVLTQRTSNTVTFENPAHDFPKKIRYTLQEDGTLEAVVSGTEEQKPQRFRFRKQQ